MSYQQTSFMSYLSLKNISESQRKVYEAIDRLGKATNNMISRDTGLPINRVTPRCQELRKTGLVTESHRGVDITGRTAIFWRVL